MNALWMLFGEGSDQGSRDDKIKLIRGNAYGTVLDIGAGHGHTIPYLDKMQVVRYIAVEPNTHMHAQIRVRAYQAGFTEEAGTLIILACGAEDIATILSTAGGPVDTLVSILTLCTVPSPQNTIWELVFHILAPGGTFLFLEHALSHRPDVAWWQAFWTPIWKYACDGCRLDRPTHLWIEDLQNDDGETVWEGGGSRWNATGWPEEHLFWRQLGRYIKAYRTSAYT